MKYIKTAILIAGMAAATAACTRKPVAPQFGMLSIDTLIGTPANGCKIEYRFATIANAEKSPALRSIEAANAGYFFELEEFGGTARQAADSALRQIVAELAFPQSAPQMTEPYEISAEAEAAVTDSLVTYIISRWSYTGGAHGMYATECHTYSLAGGYELSTADLFSERQLLGMEALLRRKLDLLLRTGQLLVESAADTNRVVRNLNRVAAYLGLPEEKLHIDVSYTMLVVNVSDGLHSFSKFQKCEKHGINMTAISEISKLSWRAIENDYSLDQYEEELERIKNKKRNYVPYVVAIGAGFACGGFCKLFGGDWMAFLFTSICAFAGFRVRARCMEFGINHYMSIAIAALISTCLAYVSSFAGLSETPYHPLLACALFIVPGVPLINFVDDMIDNYIQVGIVRAVNTVLMVCAMAFGIVIAMRLLTVEDVVIDKKFSELSMVPHDSYLVYAIAAAIAAMGFSMIFNIQRRLLWVVAVGGIIAVCTRNFVNFELGYGPVIGSFMGSMVVSLIAVKAVHWFHVPNHVLTIPSVIPMIPGVLMYRALFGLINMHGVVGEVTAVVSNGITASLIILCIALGVAVPNIFARRYIAKDRQRFLQEELQKRRERGKFIEW